MHTERRSSRPVALVVAMTVALIVGFTVGVVYAHDPRLDTADACLEKALVLLQASEGPIFDDKALHDFSKHVSQAIREIEDARADIAEAIALSNTP